MLTADCGAARPSVRATNGRQGVRVDDNILRVLAGGRVSLSLGPELIVAATGSRQWDPAATALSEPKFERG